MTRYECWYACLSVCSLQPTAADSSCVGASDILHFATSMFHMTSLAALAVGQSLAVLYKLSGTTSKQVLSHTLHLTVVHLKTVVCLTVVCLHLTADLSNAGTLVVSTSQRRYVQRHGLGGHLWDRKLCGSSPGDSSPGGVYSRHAGRLSQGPATASRCVPQSNVT